MKMLVGDPSATGQTLGITGGPTEATFLPSDLDSSRPPPVNDPNHFVAWPQGVPLVYKVWAFHADFINPANTTFTLEATVPASAFTALCPTTPDCVPQLGSATNLDAVADRLMFRNAYRMFPRSRRIAARQLHRQCQRRGGDSMVRTETHASGKLDARAGSHLSARYHLAVDGQHRVGSLGRPVIGFSASSSTINPQLRYAGRLVNDPINILTGEQHLFDGTGSQTGTDSRWGNYSDLTVDPVDECTFYYTNDTTTRRPASTGARVLATLSLLSALRRHEALGTLS